MSKEIQQKNYLLEQFMLVLNKDPHRSEIELTPDKKAHTIPIGIIEMKLDTIFFGCWETHSFNTSVVANEIHGSIVLEVTHPVTGVTLRRTGAASIQIMVDALQDEEKRNMSKRQLNAHALNVENKKPNALYLAYPKLKAECIKNAALSFGKTFGRDLNRKKIADVPEPRMRKPSALPLPELTPIDDKFKEVLMQYAHENITLEQIQQRFTLSPKTIQSLEDARATYTA